MTKSSLYPDQCRLVDLIEALGFGVIEGLAIRAGLPCYDPEPRMVQAIKLSAPERDWQPDRGGASLTLKAEFESLFALFARLLNGIVEIEVQHSLPFRLVVVRRAEELL